MTTDRVFLHHILDAISEIQEFTKDGREGFMNSRLIQAAVERKLEVVGEATKRLSAEVRARKPEIAWREMAGMRDVLIHAYHRVDLEAVWSTVEDYLPPLKVVLEELLDLERPEDQ